MKSLGQSRQFMFAGFACSFLLGVVAFFASRSEFPPDLQPVICTLDILFQIAAALAALFALRATGLAHRLEPFIDHGSPSLRALCAIAPWLVILQIALGAALRHQLAGAMSHVLGAMLVGAYLLYTATGVLTPAKPGHPTRTAALILLWLVLAQVLLGIAAYLVRFSGPDAGIPNTRLFTILHIFLADFVLATTWGLAHLIRHSACQPEPLSTP
jgi:heme A synthase